MKQKIIVIVNILLLVIGQIRAEKGAMISTGTAQGGDATIYNDENHGPNLNGGDNKGLNVRYWEDVRFKAAFLKFDISSVEIEADSARIGLMPSDIKINSHTRTFDIFGLADGELEDWKEGNITYNNAPGFESASLGNYKMNNNLTKLTSITVHDTSGGQWLYTDIDRSLDSLINHSSNDIVSFVVIRTYHTEDSWYMFNSKEAGKKVAPRLVLTSKNGKPVLPNFSPSVTLNSPAAGVEYESDTTLTALASPDDKDGSIISVEYYLDGKKVGSVSSDPWETEIELGSYTLGLHEMYAQAIDDQGAQATSDTVEFEIIKPQENKEFKARVMEKLDRGLIAFQRENDIMLSWRLLGSDTRSTGFNIYRNGTLINDQPIQDRTNYIDAKGSSSSSYYIKPVINGSEAQKSEEVNVWENNYKDISLDRPAQGPNGGTYSPNDMSVGDLDGDNEYEYIVKWYPSNAKDNSQEGVTDVTYLEAYELDGTSLWRINLGKNVRSGAHYTQFIVYDFDNNGKAEIATKTAPGTKDGQEKYLSTGPASEDDNQADYIRSDGRIKNNCPRYLTVFSGETGAELQTKMYIPQYDFRSNPEAFWGDSYGNRPERYLAAAAYFDRQRPSIVMGRGYYEGYVVAAWDWNGEDLTKRWKFVAEPDGEYGGQGNHNLAVGDVDKDGKDEIMYGSAAIDHDGTGLYTTGLGHGDAGHLGDLDPDRPGLEYYMPHEWSGPGVSFRDAGSGEIIWKKGTNAEDIGRGVAGDVKGDYRGAECWGFGSYDCKGNSINIGPQSTNFLIYWDEDLQRELLNKNYINDLEKGRLLTAEGYRSNNGTKATPNLSADLFGDWREEVIFRNESNSEIRIYTTPDTTNHRRYTLMHDPVYRLSIAWQNVAYNQPPHTGYYMPEGTSKPNIKFPAQTGIDQKFDSSDKSDVEGYKLKNSPNPFNARTNITYNLPQREKVQLTIYTIGGKKVETIVSEHMARGRHSIKYNASELASGVYFYRLDTNNKTVSKKMLLLK